MAITPIFLKGDRFFWDVGSAIAVCEDEGMQLFGGYGECDRLWDCEGAIAG